MLKNELECCVKNIFSYMEPEEPGEHDRQQDCHRLHNHNDNLAGHMREWILDHIDDAPHECYAHKGYATYRVEEQQYKKLVIPEAHTIVKPGAMMIHFQHASTAGPTVMSSVRFILPAPFTMPPLTSPLRLPHGYRWTVVISSVVYVSCI